MNEFSIPAEPAEPAESAYAPIPRRKRRMLAFGLLAVAVVGGVGFTGMRVDGADRDPGNPVWRFPSYSEKDQAGQGSKDASGLRGLLLPYDTISRGYGRGPDIGEFGSDAALSGREATALRKEEIRDLPPQTRQKLEGLIDKERIKGMAMRSYAPFNGYEGVQQPFTLTLELVRMENSASVRDIATARDEFFQALRIFPKGPAIAGHKNAACFLTPKVGGEKLGRMFCSAYVGDVLVTVNVSGTLPLATHDIADFIGRQLDRIKDPGKAV
ncbi:hypothetical protein [Streptomyces sp. NPDC002550]